ncbi:MAG: tRNA 2-selenouridine(34) synthase MnmH [Caulobacterales bacterium]|nr:tRNA 2-selenouridine(34) synthase MnmH [Caulobacterales bacterium]
MDASVLAGFDQIIDVRSPSEFAEDHLPGAINLPVLDDAERAVIGTEYVQGSKFKARRQGAVLVARNIAAHLEGALAEQTGGFKPLIYCWRGGQRSHAMATILDQVGWPVTVLDGGYQTWRRAVVAALYDQPLAHRLVRIDGPTGVGKTAMLGQLAAEGVQTLDLEGLANHRGSLFGAMPGGQPSQKLFDSRLMTALQGLDVTAPVVVEAESSRVGGVNLPKSLWRAMQAAPVIELTASLDDRVARTLRDYADFTTDLTAIAAALTSLPRHISKARRAEWLELAQAGDMDAFVRALLSEHYDPAYGRGRAEPVARVEGLEAVQAVLGRI